MKKRELKPFIKWAGGKTQLLDTLLENFNFECQKYVEVFVGGGSLFIYLLDNIEKTKIKKIIINDINEKLITVYKTIKYNVSELITELKNLENEYNSLESLDEKELKYYSIREEFNKIVSSKIKLSRDFIFLNKTCFNGLYRENSRGEYNVPFGKKDKISLFEEENLLELSKKLNLKINGEDVVILKNNNYQDLISDIDNNTMVYLDPPYRPITKNGFTSYNKSSFNDSNQIELSEFCNKINSLGAKFMLSNSDPHNLDINDNFFDDMYSDYNIQRVSARRNINSNGNQRGKINEILVKNYENFFQKEVQNMELKLFSLENSGGEMEEKFKQFLSQLKETNATLDFFVDFEKVRNNVNKISLKLNQLNYLLGKEDLEKAVEEIYSENKSSFEVLNILIAVRDKKTKVIYDGEYYELKDFFSSSKEIYKFIKLTKLEEVFRNKEIKNLVDYVYGIEVGLDTNARKNRSGKNMANIVENIFKENGISYEKEVESTKYSELSSLGKDKKRFDFVVKADKIYLIEVNFYSSSGSKLNEVARSYTDIAPKINQNKGFEFVWITDGIGWNDAKNKLEEAYYNIPSIYNLTTLKDFIEKIKKY